MSFAPLKKSRVKLRAGLAVFTAMVAGAANAQTILQCTERALPGEPINILGSGLSSGSSVQIAVVGANGSTGLWTTMQSLGQTGNVIQAKVPANYPSAMWAVRLVTQSGTSAPFYINQAEPFFTDSTQSSPGATLNIYGRNFQVIGTATVGSVEFVPPSGPTLFGTITKATPFCYTVQVPLNAVVGETYTVKISNGFGGATGYVTSASLPMVAGGADPFSLGLWWGKQFSFSSNVYNIQNDPRLSVHANGLGQTDDTNALNLALRAAGAAGGGVVYLPAGTYKIGTPSGLVVPSNVVLKGAGPAATVVLYGYEYTPSNPPTTTAAAININGRSLSGVYGLALENRSTSSAETIGLELGYPGGASDRCFVADCYLLLGNDQGIHSCMSSNIAIENDMIQCLSTNNSPMYMIGSKNVTVSNNAMVFRNGRFQFGGVSNGVITGNLISRDNTYMTANAVETGCLELSGSQNMYVQGNTLQGIGPWPVEQGCGEMINFQYGGDTDFVDVGNVTSATSTTLTSNGANWQTNAPFTPANQCQFNRAIVAIISGTGAGQWRTVSSNTSSTLTVSGPWTVVPDSTSVYEIGIWAANHALVLGNKLSNSTVGILFWDGGLDCVVDSNTVTNCGDIAIRAADVPSPLAGAHQHDLAWGDWISNNTVTNTSGNMPANICVYNLNAYGQPFGNGVFSAEIRSNTVNAHLPNTTTTYQTGTSEGFYAMDITYKGGPSNPLDNVGTLVLYNSSTNITSPFKFMSCGLLQCLQASTINP